MRQLMLLPISGFLLLANQAAPQQVAATDAKPDKKVCRMVVPVGTILPKRYCLTRAEWKELADRNENGSAENFRNRVRNGCGKPLSGSSCGGGVDN
jgi:hypothetical protein